VIGRRLGMTRAIIVYESKYGNTKKAGEAIAEGMTGIETTMKETREVKPQDLSGYDVIILGSPNHMGGPVGSIKKLIDDMGGLNMSGKYTAVFDTYMMADFEKAVKKMEKQITEKNHGIKIAASGLSIKLTGFKGPIADGELPKAKEFGEKIAKAVE
jgi:flavodoxin